MTGPGGEMPFLEHLEELRVRLLRVLAALVAGFGVGYWVVQRFHVVQLLKEPIAPFLQVTGGKLVVTSPTEPVMITLKLALVVGLVLVSPYIIYQTWAFLSPALYAREKRLVIPALLAGTLMFAGGAVFGFAVLLPKSLPILFSFQTEGLENLITFSEYFGFTLQVVLAMGLAFEIPLVIMLLTGLGVVTPSSLNRFRRYAVVLSAVAGAVLSPGGDLLSMTLMTVPIMLLYEIGFLGSWVIHRRLARRAATSVATLLALALCAGGVAAQEPEKPVPVKPGVRSAGSIPSPGTRCSRARARPSTRRTRGGWACPAAPGGPSPPTTRSSRGCSSGPGSRPPGSGPIRHWCSLKSAGSSSAARPAPDGSRPRSKPTRSRIRRRTASFAPRGTRPSSTGKRC